MFKHPYNRKRPFFAIFRYVRWQLNKQIRKKPIIYRFWNCRRIICFPDSLETMWLIYNYIMDWEEFNFIKRYLKPADIAFDVGANIGIYTLWISIFIGHKGNLISFEPDPDNYRRCLEQLKLNQLNNIKLEQIALADRTGDMRFNAKKDVESHLLFNEKTSTDSIIVNTTTLDDYCFKNNIKKINFLKIDTEGVDYFVLRGAKKVLSEGIVDVIQLEVNELMDKYNISFKELKNLLAVNGYSLCKYNVRKNCVYSINIDKLSNMNIFAVKDIGKVNQRLTINIIPKASHIIIERRGFKRYEAIAKIR